MGGQRSRTAQANFSPSMLPGKSMSVNSKEISGRDSSSVRVASLKGHEICFLDDFDSKHPQ